MKENYEITDLISKALNGQDPPVAIDGETKEKIRDLCIEYMYAQNRDEFVKEIENLVKKIVEHHMHLE